MLAIDCVYIKQNMQSSMGKSARDLLLDCVYTFLREKRGPKPIESKTSRHLHPLEEVNFRKVALALKDKAVAQVVLEVLRQTEVLQSC
jgi:hypothetical protein